MNIYDVIPQYAKMLENLDHWLDKAAAHAQAKSFDVDTLIHARLAPDQFAFARQIRAACDTAKKSAGYLSGRQPPEHPDTETTIAELRTRISKCLSFLESVTAADVSGGEDRLVAPKVFPGMLDGKWVKGDRFLIEWSLPNFYFHVTTAYAILRHTGVDLGKRDFIGTLTAHDPGSTA